MRRRLRKQLAVLAVLAAFFGGIFAIVGVIVVEPPPPSPPPPPTYDDLAVVSTALFRSGPHRADLLAIVRNPNADAGVRKVPYTFDVRSGDRTVASIRGETFFLPGQEKPVAAIHAAVPPEGTAVVVRFGSPEWVSVKSDFRPPSLIVVSRSGVVRETGEDPTSLPRNAAGPDASYEVKGVLANESELDFLTVEVTALGVGEDGDLLGVGQTFVGSLLALERREFTVSWPLLRGRVVARTREYPEVNVFSLSAIQLRTGVPGEGPGPTPLFLDGR